VDAVTDTLGAIIFVALVTTIVAHPDTASIITSFGNAFTGSLKVAEGSASH
jgi:hypothetical protein